MTFKIILGCEVGGTKKLEWNETSFLKRKCLMLAGRFEIKAASLKSRPHAGAWEREI